MLRTFAILALSLGLAYPLTAGEMDNDAGAKKATATTTASTPVSGVSELDQESPTQAHRRYGYGGWGRSYGWGRGYGWGGYYGGWRGGYCGYGWSGYYRPYYGGFSVGYYRPWGGISVAYGW
jgi:hypothetical protein